MCSVFLLAILICSNTGETHNLDVCSAFLISASDLLKSDSLPGCVFRHPCQKFQYAQTGEWLTNWMHHDVQPFLSVVLIGSNTGWLTCWTFSHSCQWFWSLQTLESNSQAGCVLSHSCQVLICSNTGEWLTCWMCVQPFLSGSDLLRH